MKNLLATIKKLNAPKIIDGEEFESNFKFETREENGQLHVYDAWECYHYDYLEEQNYLMADCAAEFGFKFTPKETDEIMEQLLAAVKADFGDDAYIEWENNVVMVVAK